MQGIDILTKCFMLDKLKLVNFPSSFTELELKCQFYQIAQIIFAKHLINHS